MSPYQLLAVKPVDQSNHSNQQIKIRNTSNSEGEQISEAFTTQFPQRNLISDECIHIKNTQIKNQKIKQQNTFHINEIT